VIVHGCRSAPFGVRARISGDGGRAWSPEVVLRQDGGSFDLGYTRAVLRPDGKVVVAYYFNTDITEERTIEATIFDPDAAFTGTPPPPSSSTTTTTTTVPPTGTTRTISAAADTYVDQSLPTRNFGTANTISADATPVRQAFLRFSVTNLPGAVASAQLRLHVKDNGDGPSDHGGTVHRVTDTAWSERGVNWSSKPALGPELGALGSVARNQWVTIDVTPAITGNGVYSFALSSPNANGAFYDTRETNRKPELIVTTSGATTPPPPPPPPTGTTRTITAVADTHVDQSLPTRNFGTTNTVSVDNSPVRRTFLRFSVANLPGSVTNARLRLHVKDNADGPSEHGGTVHRVDDNAWSETGVNWSSQPALGPAVGSFGAVARNQWVTIDVTPVINGNGVYTFALSSANANGAFYDTRETNRKPELIVTTAG
jgi:hypothetical protein